MTPDELRALADALEPMARAPRFEDFDVPGFCAWVRACADAQPVAHCAMLDSHRRLVERAIEDAARPSGMSTHDGKAHIDASVLRRMLAIIDSSPAVPQDEPCIGNDSACPCQDGDACHYKDAADGTKAWPVPQAEPKLGELMREQRNSRIVAGAYPDGNPNAGAMMAQTRQAEPKRGLTCLWSRADDDTDMWETSCGHAFTIIDGTPSDNHMGFCCYCGRRVDEEIGGSDAE